MAPVKQVSALLALSLLASSAAANSSPLAAANAPLAHRDLLGRDAPGSIDSSNGIGRVRRHHQTQRHNKRLVNIIGGLGHDVGGLVNGMAGGLFGHGTSNDSDQVQPASSDPGGASGDGDAGSGQDTQNGSAFEATLYTKRDVREEAALDRRLIGSLFGLDGPGPSSNNNNNNNNDNNNNAGSSSSPASSPASAPASSPQPSASASQSGNGGKASKDGDGGSTSANNHPSSPSNSAPNSAPSSNANPSTSASSPTSNNNGHNNNDNNNNNNNNNNDNNNNNKNNNDNNNNNAKSHSSSPESSSSDSNNNHNNSATGHRTNTASQHAASTAPSSSSGNSNHATDQQANAAAYSASAANAVSAALASTADAAAATATAAAVPESSDTTATLEEGAAPTAVGASTTLRAAGTGAAANKDASEEDSSGDSSKIVVPIVVVTASLALCAVGWTLFKKARDSRSNRNDPRMRPIDFGPNRFSMATDGGAYAIGGASAGGFGVHRRPRNSEESFGPARPMSVLTEETYDYEKSGPPMQEVSNPVSFQAVGSAYTPYNAGSLPMVPVAGAASPAGRKNNYGRGGRAQGEGWDAGSVAPSDYEAAYATDYEDDPRAAAYHHGGGYYHGSSRGGYTNPAARGMDVAGAYSSGGHDYLPYAGVDRHNDDGASTYTSGQGRSRQVLANPFADERIEYSSRGSG